MKKLKNWLVTIVRLAIKLELDVRLTNCENKLTRIETCLTAAADRVKTKHDAKKPPRPRNWSEAKERLEGGE